MRMAPALSLVALATATFSLLGKPQTIPVEGTWSNATKQGNGPLSDANTFSPIVGDGSANSAGGEMIHSPFPPISLMNHGDKLILTGAVTLFGTANSAAGSATPRTQFRFGVFHDDGDGDDLEWVGYYMSNRHGNAGMPAGALARKPVGNTSAYLSTAGHTQLTSVEGDGTATSLFHDGTYGMRMIIERSGADLVTTARLVGSTGFTQTLAATDKAVATSGTYTFNRVGFLLGANLAVDQATFSEVQVTYVPAPARPSITRTNSAVDVTEPREPNRAKVEATPNLPPATTWDIVHENDLTNPVDRPKTKGR